MAEQQLAVLSPKSSFISMSNIDLSLLLDAPLIIIDTEILSAARLQQLLEETHHLPSILLVPDLTAISRYTRYLSARRSLLSRADLAGFGFAQTLQHLLERESLQRQLMRTAQELKQHSTCDEVTGLFHHHHFEKLLFNECRKANRYRRPLALVLVSVIRPPSERRRARASSNPQTLKLVSQIIRDKIRDVDIPGRFAESSFGIILPETDEEAASIVATRITDALAEYLEQHAQSKPAPLLCFGLAALSDTTRTKDELQNLASTALQYAESGKAAPICSAKTLPQHAALANPEHEVIVGLSHRLSQLTRDAEQIYFRSIMKEVSNLSIMQEMILPHAERVAFFSQRLAEHAGLTKEESQSIFRAGHLHDIGKLGVDVGILKKPGRLAAAEEEVMMQHPQMGVQIMGRKTMLSAEREAILHHHERFDGTGYPDGLREKSIPLSARIISIAEAWDVMISAQPYRQEPLPLASAVEQLKRGAGIQFDPDLVHHFLGMLSG